MNTKRPNILAIVNGIIPSVTIGIIRPLLELQNKGKVNFRIILSRFYKATDLVNIDLVIFCRNCDMSEIACLNDIFRKKIPYIYELDDSFFAIDSTTALGYHYRQPVIQYVFKKFLKNAELIRVYNVKLAARCAEINKQVAVTNCYFDIDLLKQVTRSPTKKIRIAYATSRFKTDTMQDIFLEALIHIAKKYADKVEIFFFGISVKCQATKECKNIFYVSPILNYVKFIKTFYSMNLDIGLAPLQDDEFHNSKTNNKYREYGACGVAGVYSNVPLYQQCVRDNENGILVNNTKEEWLAGLEKLINQPELLAKIKKHAYEDVKQNYSLEMQVHYWEKHIFEVLSQSYQSKKILYYNVACLKEFSISLNIVFNNIISDSYYPLWVLFISTHDLAYEKGIRNFFIYLECLDNFIELKKIRFKEDCRYLIYDSRSYLFSQELKLPANVYVMGSFNSLKEHGFVFDNFLIAENHKLAFSITRLGKIAFVLYNKLMKVAYDMRKVKDIFQKIWWYKSVIFNLIKINYFKRY